MLKIFTKYVFYFVAIMVVAVNGTNNLLAQITVNDSKTITDMVQSLAGEGVTITNVTSNSHPSAVGEFTDPFGALGVDEGLLMTTGRAIDALGPNDRGGKGVDLLRGQSFDTDLRQLTSSDTLYDICIIEFDITVYSEELTFDYVFASEEYPNYLTFNDVFGFFISGPGIFGKKNLAVIPNTNIPVSVSNINQTTAYSNYYIPYGNGDNPFFYTDMQYDGYTKVLTASTPVIPCEVYHIKLAIADVKDGILDSGVFIEKGSFKSNPLKLSTRLEYPHFDNMIEGCNDGYFVFERAGTSLKSPNTAYTFDYTLLGSATNTQDYSTLANGQLTLEAGVMKKEIAFEALTDLIIEGEETITLRVDNVNNNTNCIVVPPVTSATLSIKEDYEIEIPNEKLCIGNTIQLNKNADTEYTYSWSPSTGLSCTDCPSPMTDVVNTTTYSVDIVDKRSGCKTSTTTTVEVSPPPVAGFTYDTDEKYTSLDIFFSNTSENGADEFYWDFGDGTTSTERNPSHYYDVPNQQDPLVFTVTLIARNSNFEDCEDIYTEKIIINDPLFIPNVITPNRDNKNDMFAVKGITEGIWTFEVFNRWGDKVYTTNQFDNNWTAEGFSDGTYYYRLENPNKDRAYKGWLQITRP